MNRFATGHRDSNHRVVADAFARAGCSVLELTQVGAGCPDLCIGIGGRTFLVEVKDGSKPPSRRALRKTQVDFIASWRGSPIHVVTGPVEAWNLANLLRCSNPRNP